MKSVLLLTMVTFGISSVLLAFAAEEDGFQIVASAMDARSPTIDSQELTDRDLPVLEEGATLADYLAYAALNNPGLEAAFNRWKASLEHAAQVRYLPDPRFSYRYFINEVETRVGPQRQGVKLAQKFPWFGVLRLRSNAAMEAANAAHAQYEARKLKLFHRVKDAYYEYYYVSRAAVLVREHLTLMERFEEALRNRYKTGLATNAQLIRTQVELGKLHDQLRSLEDLRSPAAARLNAELDRPSDAHIPEPVTPLLEQIDCTEEELLSLLEETSPELTELEHNAASAKHAMDLARKQRLPDVTLGLMYIDTDEAAMGPVPDSGKDPVAAMLSLNLPIWAGKYRAAEREARARHLTAVSMKQERGNTLRAEIAMTLFKLRDAERKIDLYGQTLMPKAIQSMTATEAAFRSGTATFLDVVDAQRILLEFHLSHERALVDFGQSLAKLEMLIGRPIETSAGHAIVGGESEDSRYEGADR